MAYLPKSQFTIKSASENEFIYKDSKAPFMGLYLETSNGTKYAGTDNTKLGLIIIPTPFIDKWETKQAVYQGLDIKRFNIIKKDIKDFLKGTRAIPSSKKYPSKSEYSKGYFIKYFTKRINGNSYQEIDKEVYDDITKKGGIYDYNLYKVGKIRWNLKGNVFKDNAIKLKELERSFLNISSLFPIFNEFAREPMQNQENLYTAGGELYYGDGTEYMGAYHIHMTNGPMQGAYHTEVEHSKLYYISELPKPDNMSYEDFMAGYPPIPPNANPYLPISNDVRGPSNIPTDVDPPPPPYVGESYNCITSWGPAPPGYLGLTIATSEEDPNGLVPVGGACVDPGDGTGMYNPKDYGSRFAQACYSACQGSYVNDTSTGNEGGTGGVGCKMPWDDNYCEPCVTHDQTMCANNYTIFSGTGNTSSGGYGGSTGGVYLGNTCFTSETSIIMEDETIKRIDEVKVGDIVKSEINTSNVIGIDIHKEKEHTIYSINNSEAFVTAEHPFKTTTGWKAIDPLETFKTHGIESNVLEIGDTLITKEGTEEVKSIEKSTKTTNTVYNLRLDNEHVYYANGYLVHNNKYGGMGMDDLEGLAINWSEEMGYDFGGFALEQCPCGMWEGVMQYSDSCC